MLVLALLVLSQDLPASSAPQGPPPPDSAAWLNPVQGTMTMKLRYREDSTASETDLYEFLTLSYGNPARDPVTAALAARFAEDLSGNQAIHGFYPFTSIDDSYRSLATQQLYTAYLQLHPADAAWTARLGRQTLEDVPEAVLMDGSWLGVQAGPHVQVSTYGGIPTNLYESSPEGHWMVGATAQYIPDPALPGRYGVEYLHLRDDNLFGLHDDNLTGFTIDDGLDPLRLHLRYTLLDGKSRDLVGRVTAQDADAGFLVELQGTYVFHQIESLSYAIDPFASFMMSLEPYVDLLARASKSFGEHFVIDASFDSRRLIRDAVESVYNHVYKHADVTPKLLGWPLPGMSIGVSADFWNSSGENFTTVGADLAVPVQRDVLLTLGSSYALYAIDEFTGEEHDRVRILTAQLKWKLDKNSTLYFRFTYEENSIDRFRIVEFGFRHAF